MTMRTKTGLAVAAAIAVASCSVGRDMCGKGYVEKRGACEKVTAHGGTTSTPTKDANLDGVADENQTGTVTGIGDTCKVQPDCKGKVANYCAIDPTNGVGACTIKDCTITPDNCPSGFRCCQLPASLNYPALCFPRDRDDVLVALGYCPK